MLISIVGGDIGSTSFCSGDLIPKEMITTATIMITAGTIIIFINTLQNNRKWLLLPIRALCPPAS
jgi:hypothetical protein